MRVPVIEVEGEMSLVRLCSVLLLLLTACGETEPPPAATESAPGAGRVDGARIAAADLEPGNWLAHGRTYSEQRFTMAPSSSSAIVANAEHRLIKIACIDDGSPPT